MCIVLRLLDMYFICQKVSLKAVITVLMYGYNIANTVKNVTGTYLM